MRLAIMQPYFFPYLGYFKLIKTVDRFVFLTDVQFVRRSWIVRNRIRSSTGWQYISVPVKKAAIDTNINEMVINNNLPWRELITNKLLHTFGRKSIEHPICKFINYEYDMLHELLIDTICDAANYFNLECKFDMSSDLGIKSVGIQRIIDICSVYQASTYVNLPGGINLYRSDDFEPSGIKLEFIPQEEQMLSILDLCLGDGVVSI